MRALNSNPNVDLSDLLNYPDGRIKDNTGSGNGTGVNERVKGDLHQAIAKLMRLYGIVPNGLPDNETNGFQIVDALKALASKNDYIYPLSSSAGVLQVDIKLSAMQTGEFIVCLAAVNKTTETQIKGIGVGSFAITYSGTFKVNEYVRVIKTSGGVSIVRLSDATSLDAMVNDFLYLKKASQAQENAGALDTVATTPLTNLVAFTRRVIGLDSGDFLATASNHGLYPMAHFSIVAALGADPVRNKGWVSGIDVNNGTIGSTYAVSGDIVSATLSNKNSNGMIITVVVDNTMTDTNFYVRAFIEGLTVSNKYKDVSISPIVFSPVSATSFTICVREYVSELQNLKIHFEIVKI